MNARQQTLAKKGFTLVEVLVAALLVLLMVLSTVAIMRHGQQVAALDQQRNLARQTMVTELEKIEYSHILFDSLALDTFSTTYLIDNRGNADPLDDMKGTMRIEIDSQDITVNSELIPRKRAKATTYWTSLDGSDTLILETWICKVIF